MLLSAVWCYLVEYTWKIGNVRGWQLGLWGRFMALEIFWDPFGRGDQRDGKRHFSMGGKLTSPSTRQLADISPVII